MIKSADSILTRRPAKLFTTKIHFIMLVEFFQCMHSTREKFERKISTTFIKNTNMFCNICKYGVRSKHFSCIFVCYSQEARDSEQLGFLWIKSLFFILLKVKVFFSRCNKEVSMKRQEESRLMMLAWKARNSHLPWINMHL